MSSELTLSPSCGCRGDFTKDAIALYGVRACYVMSPDCEHTFDLAPTFAELIAVDEETRAEFKRKLEGELGFIEMARLLFREHEEFTRAESFREDYHVAPTCIFDIGPCAFYAKKAGTYVYVTWAYYKRPLDFDAAQRWALTREVYNLRRMVWR